MAILLNSRALRDNFVSLFLVIISVLNILTLTTKIVPRELQRLIGWDLLSSPMTCRVWSMAIIFFKLSISWTIVVLGAARLAILVSPKRLVHTKQLRGQSQNVCTN
ncbi:uncharacterized protein LOC101848493 [Aplysia californica]|uniref:Uncharacterized protein LOC101848493 n=1 Tax=Aplysia californica TaxID=6500 RepID=A0ABM1AFS8_APLCA|nr:uncharacterized protein LOC101848493 [Aplysia californica]